MKPTTRLSSAVFHLTPTRTRCDLIIIANDKKEKIASGLLNPFLAHLKTAQEQVSKGGYSILLEPVASNDAAWFTKATLKRFVRFVSTPEILERVYTIETEILQIEEAIKMQSRHDIGQSTVENHQPKPLGGSEDKESASNFNEEKAIVLYKVFWDTLRELTKMDRSSDSFEISAGEVENGLMPGAPTPEDNGSCLQEGNSKVQLLKILETRKTVLQKEQGMAFARAVAAGFDIDQMEPLLAFAECFGALRLMEAASRFMNLWKIKHETGQWLDIEESEALSNRSDFSAMNSSGIVLSASPSKNDVSNPEVASENNGRSGPANNADNPVPNGQQEYFHGQFPHLVFPPWTMHPLPGAQPAFQAYPVQGVPFYQNYNGTVPFFQPPNHQMEHSPPNFGYPSGPISNIGSETWDADRTRSPNDMEEEASHYQKPRQKAGGPKKKQSGVVVIRNINYITSQEKKSSSEIDSGSASGDDTEGENFEADGPDVICQNSKKSSKRKGVPVENLNINDNEVSAVGKVTDDEHWQAFQNCLLRGGDEDAHASSKGMFAMEKDFSKKRSLKTVGDDPLASGAQDKGQMEDNGVDDVVRFSGSTPRRTRGSGDGTLFSNANDYSRGNNNPADIHFVETNGRKILPRTSHEDFMIGSQQKQEYIRNQSDPLAGNTFERGNSKMDMTSSHEVNDETFIVPFRSMSLNQVGQGRSAIDIDSEIPAAHQMLNMNGNKNIVNYEPNDLNLLPERGPESVGYDPALDYEMQVCADGSQKKGAKVLANVKGGLRKSDKVGRSKLTSDSAYKQRSGGPMRNIRSSKMSPLEDARARAERLRSYKADLQKMKKEKEMAESKRIEALKLERQRRIASRGTSAAAKAITISPQSKQLPAKLSPAARASKFSDSEPGSSSPLQRSKIKTSLGSSELPKISKASKLSASSQSIGNRLTKSSSSLSETKRESSGVIPDSKASMARIRRLSEPKTINSPVTSVKARSAEVASKKKLSDGVDRNKMSAIITLDRSKAATLPELKIKTSKSPVTATEKAPAVTDGQKDNGTKPSIYENVKLNGSNGSTKHEIDPDDNPIVEKTVVMLEYEKPSLPSLQSSEGKSEVKNRQHDGPEKSRVLPEVTTAFSVHSSNLSNKSDEKPYRAPHARVSSLEHPGAGPLEYCKLPVASAGNEMRAEETVKEQVLDAKSPKVDKTQMASERNLVKESSKGLRRLLKFGKKNHTSSVDLSVDSDGTSLDGIEPEDNIRHTSSSSEVHTLKNLISLDETSPASNGLQKGSRHFSIFSPFRSKTSEKKQAS